MDNFTCHLDSLASRSPGGASPEFIGTVEELLSSLETDWNPSQWDARQVRILDDCQPSVAGAGLAASNGFHGWVDSAQSSDVVIQEFFAEQAPSTSPVVNACRTDKILPSVEEKILVRRMLVDALVCHNKPLSSTSADKKIPDSLVSDTVRDGIDNYQVDMPTVQPVNPIHAQPGQVNGCMPRHEVAVKSRKKSPLATLSTWLNGLSRPQRAAQPKRLKGHSVRSHPYTPVIKEDLCTSHRRRETPATSLPVGLAQVSDPDAVPVAANAIPLS